MKLRSCRTVAEYNEIRPKVGHSQVAGIGPAVRGEHTDTSLREGAGAFVT